MCFAYHSTNSQKPNDELYNNFKASFPQLLGGNGEPNPPSLHLPLHGATSLSDALDVAMNPRYVSLSRAPAAFGARSGSTQRAFEPTTARMSCCM